MTTRVRFAPSPTGNLHIGNARTAIYNYLFAKATKGTLILRVEDTDLERSSKIFEKEILEDLQWLGLHWDEGVESSGDYGPYYQSQRLDIYEKYANILIEKDLAYYCFLTEEELEEMKEQALREGKPPHYTGVWKESSKKKEALLKVAAGDSYTVRFRAPHKSYLVEDIVRGRIIYPEGMVGDFVLIRSNKLPTYNFCNVVDDMLMKITHVIRGEDHLSNTLRQLMIYEALQIKPPEFAHLSLLINQERQKLSKRDGVTSVKNYKDQGYESEAIVNYLTLLGWSYGEETDIFSLEEASKKFSLNRVSKSPAIYDIKKLHWINSQYVRKKSLQDFDIQQKEFQGLSLEDQEKAIHLFKNQITFAHDFEKLFEDFIFFKKKYKTEEGEELVKNIDKEKFYSFVQALLDTKTASQEIIGQIGTEFHLKGKALFLTVRYLLTGYLQGPELPLLLDLISKDRLLLMPV
jgi:nondiscriminating glutamyl-tRNA synthetase